MRCAPVHSPVSDSPAKPNEPWTTRTLLAWMTGAFRDRGLDSPRLQAEMLLAHVLGCERMRLYMDADREASPAERDALRALVQRALRHEPIQYLVGSEHFFGMRFAVDPRVLIPRPSTETIVQHVLEEARRRASPGGEGLAIADVCTGSGCIAVALLRHLPAARAVATDTCPAALEVAAANAAEHGVADRLELRRGDLLAPLGEQRFDFITSNPPYIPDDEWEAVEPNVKDHEPHAALRGGADGMRFAAPIIRGAHRNLAPLGAALVEVAASRADDAAAGARESGWSRVRVLRDCDDLPRVLVLEESMPTPAL